MIQRSSQEAIPEGRGQEGAEVQYRAVEQALLMRSAAIAPRSTRFSRRNDACERSSEVTKASKAPNTGGNMGDLIDIEQLQEKTYFVQEWGQAERGSSRSLFRINGKDREQQ
jgi:hypothetical protein